MDVPLCVANMEKDEVLATCRVTDRSLDHDQDLKELAETVLDSVKNVSHTMVKKQVLEDMIGEDGNIALDTEHCAGGHHYFSPGCPCANKKDVGHVEPPTRPKAC